MMMAENEDLALSLGLCSYGNDRFPLKLNLFQSNLASSSKARWTEVEEGDEEVATGAWSPVSTLSSLSGKRCEREENEGDEDGENSRKKLRLSKEQTTVLEDSFKENNTLNTRQKQALAKRLNLRPRQVEVWFQNRRARTKLKQTEVEYEYMKRWCQKLAEDNKRLHKEVGELRALNSVSPQLHMNLSPPTTLTMCPSCERVTAPISNSTIATTSPFSNQQHHQHFLFPIAANPNPWASILHQTS